jgi:hypothetical protein
MWTFLPTSADHGASVLLCSSIAPPPRPPPVPLITGTAFVFSATQLQLDRLSRHSVMTKTGFPSIPSYNHQTKAVLHRAEKESLAQASISHTGGQSGQALRRPSSRILAPTAPPRCGSFFVWVVDVDQLCFDNFGGGGVSVFKLSKLLLQL